MTRTVDITGQRFGSLVAVSYAGARRWRCICDCGVITLTPGNRLRRGLAGSCGCMKAEKLRIAATKHGLSASPEYKAWCGMRQRCMNPNDSSYADYGGRGISICTRWASFDAFYADMGPRPPDHEIDRIEVNGNYEPGNCRWATVEVQSNNKRTSRRVTYRGRTQTIAQWARELGLNRTTLHFRIFDRKLPLEQAMRTELTTPHERAVLGGKARVQRSLVEEGA